MSNLDDFIPGPKLKYQVCSCALSPSRLPGLDYALNPYVGCSHNCTYCYAPNILKIDRSAWNDVKVKSGISKLLSKELKTKRGVIGLGTVTDPYQPIESVIHNTRQCLQEISKEDLPVSLLTKSDLAIRDLNLYANLTRAEIGFSISTDDEHSKFFEKDVPLPSKRLAAAKEFVDIGLNVYILIGPTIYGITDKSDSLINDIADSGIKRVMVDRLNLRPGLSDTLENILPFSSINSDQVSNLIKFRCKSAGIKVEDVF